jgi:anti-sigma factor RsiW
MTPCWTEGELRAFIDRELPPETIERISSHLEECSACGDLWSELAGRAGRVSALMSVLGDSRSPAVPIPVRARPVRRWIALGLAAAAALLLGILAIPKHPQTVPGMPAASPAATEQSQWNVLEPVAPAPSLAVAPRARTVSARPVRKPPAPRAQPDEPFLPLDDEPIETGVIMRVELGPRQVPADVIIGPDGRPRAIRLVHSASNR